jgi:hypothetical protein
MNQNNDETDFWNEVKGNLKGPVASFRDYWQMFGGWSALLGSTYLWFAVLIGSFLVWFKGSIKWDDTALSILPSLLGFTVAAYAILVAFGDEKFKQVLVIYPKASERSFFLTVNGAFCHFIVIQCMALVYAVVFKTLGLNAIKYQWIGIVLLMYSLFLTIAVSLAVLKIAKIYQTLIRQGIPERVICQQKQEPEPHEDDGLQSVESSSPHNSGNISMVSPYCGSARCIEP